MPLLIDARIAAALALDDAAHQVLRHIIGGGMPGDQRVEIAIGVETGHALVLVRKRPTPRRQRDQNSCKANIANHVGSRVFGMRGLSSGTSATL